MRSFILTLFILYGISASAQEERDTVLSRCPIYILDTVSNNNFFIDARPATLKVYRTKGDLTLVVEQKDQFFTIFFNDRKFRNTRYKIAAFPRGNNEISAKYSFRSGDQVSYVNVASGIVEVVYDKEKEFWRVKVSGLIANQVERSVSYYKVKAELLVK